jgi:hypothetical protein
MRLRLDLSLILVACLAGAAWAQWSEPTFTPDLMSAPLTPPPAPAGSGVTRYVDGANLGGTCANSGTATVITSPWCTLAHALTQVNAGDLVYVRAHTYNTGNLTTTRDGSAGNYITFRRYPGDARPVINCSGLTFCFENTWAGSYYVFDGFEIRNSVQQLGVFCENVDVPNGCPDANGAHHLWFINGIYHDSSTSGIADDFAGWYVGASHTVWSNNEFYNNPKIAWLAWGPNSHHVIFEFNHVHDNGRNGDDDGGVKCGGNTYACIMRYNTAWNNYRATDATGPCFAGGSNCSGVAALYIDFADDHLQGTMSYMYNNLVFDNDHGMQSNCAPSVGIFNNVVFHNGYTPGQPQFTPPNTTRYDYGRGLNISVAAFGGAAEDCGQTVGFVNMQVYNNTVVNNWGDGLWLRQLPDTSPPVTGVHLRNNIFQNNAEKGGGSEFEVYLELAFGTTGNADLNHDILVPRSGKTIQFNGGNYTSISQIQARPGNTTWVNGLGTAATFVNAGAGDYHLTAASPGFNQGATVGLFNYDRNNVSRPQGGTWDIGAYEGGGTIPAAPANLRVVSP